MLIGFVVDVEHPTFDSHPRLAPLVQLSRSAHQRPSRRLGFTEAEVNALRARAILA